MKRQNQVSTKQVSGQLKVEVEKTQDMLEAEVEQLLKEEGNVDRERNGDGLQQLHRHMRNKMFQEKFLSVEKGNFESDKNSKYRAQELDSAIH